MIKAKGSVAMLEDKWLSAQDARNAWSLLWYLALCRRPIAMTELARRLGSGGAFGNSFSPRGLARRAYMLGDATGAYNLAMEDFNRRDLKGYRYWLGKAAASGFPDAREQFRHFDTRLPHVAAREIGRGRPRRSYE